MILEGQTALVRAHSGPLGGPVHIRAEPGTAFVDIDGVRVGTGSWSGSLPAGKYRVTVSEAGYRPKTVVLSYLPGEGRRELRVPLAVEPDHPRWPRPPKPAELWADVFGGAALGATLGSAAEDACPSRCGGGDPSVVGGFVGARGGYRFPFGVSLELGAGYLYARASFDREVADRFGEGDAYEVRYALHDAVSVQGPFVVGGASYHLPLVGRFGVFGRILAGALLASAYDPIEGTATSGPTGAGARGRVELANGDQTVQSGALVVLPAVGADVRFGRVEVGAGLGLMIVASGGARFEHGSLRAAAPLEPNNPGAVGNAPATSALADERAYGSFVLWVPHVSAGWRF
jgi:hypothetical protein